jgi:DNA-binding beta-propeller fold protein YncE
VAPAGATGCVEAFDTGSFAQTSLCGVGAAAAYAGGHGAGTTSADFGAGFVFAIDRGSPSLKVIDPKLKRVVASAPLDASPDYVRWIGSTRQLWVTEPDREQIEVFAVASDDASRIARVGTISVKGGPESLVIDSLHDRAFTHLWQGSTVEIAIGSQAVVRSFPNGCRGSRGIALDAARGQLFAGCAEGRAVVLDVDHDHEILSAVTTPSGVDILALSPTLHHLYVPAASDGTVTVLSVARHGGLSKLGVLQASQGTHCAISDDHGRVWVCAPDAGSLLVFEDPFSPTKE